MTKACGRVRGEHGQQEDDESGPGKLALVIGTVIHGPAQMRQQQEAEGEEGEAKAGDNEEKRGELEEEVVIGGEGERHRHDREDRNPGLCEIVRQRGASEALLLLGTKSERQPSMKPTPSAASHLPFLYETQVTGDRLRKASAFGPGNPTAARRALFSQRTRGAG